MTRSFKKVTVLAAIVLLALVMSIWAFVASPSFAYFRALLDENGSHNMMIELIFDRLNQEGFDAYAEKYQDVYGRDGQPFSPNESAEWGTRENPYVISQKYHVQNLSVLQRVGFFENRLDAEGKPKQAHFLVCNPNGTPVVIDCGGMALSPVGTHEHPFTGVINGAPATGEATYAGYGSSISGFANLTITSTLDEPDIGFFGKLGYYGEKNVTQDGFGNDVITVTGGYAATVQDLLLADVTIQSRRSLGQILSDWWAEFSGHVNHSDERAETHHVGIIAGHAEFATVKSVSVYYSEDVAAFDLISNEEGSQTNYYSSTGLLGLLECVNPVVTESGVLDGSNAISDSILVGNGSEGGGGDESGTMTGYFLAKNLYDRHEDYLEYYELTTKDKYSVTEMHELVTENGKTVGKSLFEKVTMAERDDPGWTKWEYRNYFYFQDTVFTFAMSMSVASDKDGNATETADESDSDYIQTIWKLEEKTPSISATASFDNLKYGPDPNAKPQIAYHLEAVDSDSLTEDGYYVLSYLDKGASSSTEDDVLYILNLNDTTGKEGYVRAVPVDEMHGETVYENGYIKSMNLIGVSPTYYDYSFQYDKSGGYSIKRPDSDYKFGITATDYEKPTTVISTSNTASGNLWQTDPVFDYGWNFNARSGDPYRFSVTKYHRFGIILPAYGWSKLQFSEGKLSFYTEMSRNSSKEDEEIQLDDKINYFTVFKVNTNTYDEDGNITNEDATDNEQLTPKNILSDSDLYSFDPSKYVLQYVGNSSEGGYSLGNYKLLPIRSLKLNNGRGELLSEINHIAKLYKNHNENYQLTIGNLFSGNFGNLVSNLIDTNSGGVLNTTIGTSNTEVYSIPTGMTAFEINKASPEEPSYINIIVAVNPEQEAIGTVGLWAMNKQSWKQSFDLSSYTPYSFDLPISKTAKGSSDLKYAIKVTERVVETEVEGKRIFEVVADEQGNNEVSYMYLGGETVLVYYSFSITSTGVYLLGSKAGPLSVAYFSVTGAAGQGDDGMSGSPLGNVDFVYDYGGTIITTDKHYGGEAPLVNLEEYDKYYPSYLLIGMLPEQNQSGDVKIQNEVIKIRRYIKTQGDSFGTKRHLKMLGENYTAIRSASPVMEDYQDDTDDD